MRLGKWLPQSNPVAVDPANTYDWSNFFYDYADRMTIADNGVSKVERTYDAAGRLLTDKETFKDLTNGARQVTYTYYPNNKVARIYVPGGYDFMQSYDGLGRLSQIRYTGDQNASYGYFYDAASNVKRRVSWRNGTWVDYKYDRLNRIEQRDIIVPTTQIARGWFSKEHYGYDGMNRLISTEREEDGLRDSFIYDLSGQLKTAYYGLHPSGANWINPTRTVVYVWDDVGNRTQVAETGQGTKIYTPNAYNQYTAAGADAVGNGSVHEIYGYKGVRYQYYGDTFLSSVVTGPTDNPTNTYELFYDALGRCVKRRLNGVSNYYLYDGEHWIVEYDGTGAIKSNTVYGLGIDEVVVRGIGTGQWPLPDRNGNTTVVTGPGGMIKESYRYDAFGAPTFRNAAGTIIDPPASAIGNRFLFTGREYNSQFGFYEFRARAYHPGLGRFMSEDPIGFDAGDYNLYRYCGNDPWDETDPMGMEPSPQQKPEQPDPPPRRPKPTPFTSTVLEGPGTPGAAAGSRMKAPSRQGTHGTMGIPSERYDTAREAGKEAVDDIYPAAERDRSHEWTGPLGQVSGAKRGQYFAGPAEQGLGLIPWGKQHAGDQGSYIDRLTERLPRGSHLIGYYTVHIHRDPSRLRKIDAPIFRQHWKFDPVIIMKSPGQNGNWDRPQIFYYP